MEAEVVSKLLTLREAAERLNVSVSYIRNSDCPKIVLPGGRGPGRSLIRVSSADLDAWIAARRVA